MSAYRHLIAKLAGSLLLAAALAVGTTAPAEAAFVAAICNDAACDGVGDVIVSDDGAGDLAAGVPGIIAVIGSVGGFEFALNSSQSKPALGSAGNPTINLSYSLSNLVGGAAEIFLFAGDNDFTGTGHATLVGNSALAGLATATEIFALGGDANDVLNLAPVIVSAGPFLGTFSASAVSGGEVGFAVNPYSLTAGVHVSMPGVGSTSGDITVTVPEPASLTLFGLGLLGVAGILRRRIVANRT